MANDSPTARRTLQFKFTLPTSDASVLLSLLKAARPFHEAFGGKKFRLLQNVDDPARYVHEIEYEIHEAIEFNRQRFASDPRVRGDAAVLAGHAGRPDRDGRLPGGRVALAPHTKPLLHPHREEGAISAVTRVFDALWRRTMPIIPS